MRSAAGPAFTERNPLPANEDEGLHYRDLSPDEILSAVESRGYVADGRLLALNSYENRVYQVGVQDGRPVVAKFYRPRRWSDEAIREEHRFTLELAGKELPIVSPLAENDESLFAYRDFRFSLYPSVGGRPPELEDSSVLEQLGRLLGRMHAVGAVKTFAYRETLSLERMAVESRNFLLERKFIPENLVEAYASVADDLIARIRRAFERVGTIDRIRLHGDLHAGNILWSQDGPLLLDFDDACSGPAIQDFWMLLGGGREAMTLALQDLLEGYCQFFDFEPRELHLIESLRSLRIMHYSAWLARRWPEPAFERAFPWFNTQRYWEDHILSLREQSALIDEPPLELGN